MTTESIIFPRAILAAPRRPPRPSLDSPHLARQMREAVLLLQEAGRRASLPETANHMAWGRGPDGDGESCFQSQMCLGALGERRRDRKLAAESWGQPEGKII